MTINVAKDTFYCYVCAIYGDHIDAIRHIEECNQLQALLIFEKIENDEHVNSVVNNTKIKFKPTISFAEGIKNARFWYLKSLQTDWDIETFDYMFNRGFTPKALNEVGVRMTYNKEYKIICPIVENGHFRGYVKRRTDGEDTVRKYIYNDGFKVSKVIQGNYFRDWVVITEGYMDWLKLYQNGFKNSCAILKWKASSWQLKKLAKVTNKVISALDDSDTGEEGTRLLMEHFDEVIRFPFPYGAKDCGDMTDKEMLVAKFHLRNEIERRG